MRGRSQRKEVLSTVRCPACGEVVEYDEPACNVCVRRYHRKGCGITTTYSALCNVCRFGGKDVLEHS